MDNLNYGVIGNSTSAALISDRASIDWACLPNFDSSSIFAKILDAKKGGSFEIICSESYTVKQSYIGLTNILRTEFNDGRNAFAVLDFMPRYKEDNGNYYAPPDIIRYIEHISGEPEFRVIYNPRLEYAEHPVKISFHQKYIKAYTTDGAYDSVYLYTDLDKQAVVDSQIIRLKEDAYFLLGYNQKLLPQSVAHSKLKFERTKVYWLNWSERTKQFAKYDKDIMRSALVLKMLTYEKTGAVLAALTTSLPETIGEVRNWDYRFCWLRDSSMVVKVMSEIGHENIARRYIRFIVDIIPDKDEQIQIMYGINREKKLEEKILEHLSGYENSAPVRVGNAAYVQKQHDIYGILMDVIHRYFKMFSHSLAHGEDLWTITRSIIKTVQRTWQEPDRGIWEIRTEQKHFTFSKVLCWVALDRGIKIAEMLNMQSYTEEWTEYADTIKADIEKNAWNEKVSAYTQFYGSEDLDASNLLMESYGFISANNPKYISTVKATQKELSRDGLMYRYKNHDDFGLPSSSFTICTFWLINSLHSIGETEEAKTLFDQLLSYSNHLGLFSEDIDFVTKRLLGNFPQAYSHLALIETAINISGGKTAAAQELKELIR